MSNIYKDSRGSSMILQLYRDAPADVVITDLLMPERDGLEVTLALTREFLDA